LIVCGRIAAAQPAQGDELEAVEHARGKRQDERNIAEAQEAEMALGVQDQHEPEDRDRHEQQIAQVRPQRQQEPQHQQLPHRRGFEQEGRHRERQHRDRRQQAQDHAGPEPAAQEQKPAMAAPGEVGVADRPRQQHEREDGAAQQHQLPDRNAPVDRGDETEADREHEVCKDDAGISVRHARRPGRSPHVLLPPRNKTERPATGSG
jgi:hypothetical protein